MLKKLTALATALLSAGLTSAADPPGWELVWSDEFDGATLDLSKWGFEVNARGGGNNELQYYVTNNIRLRDGQLIVEARKQQSPVPKALAITPPPASARDVKATGFTDASTCARNCPKAKACGRRSG